MAHTARLLRFLLISVIILVNVETKELHKAHRHSKRANGHHQYPGSTSKPHTYPHTFGGSGGGTQVTRRTSHLGNTPQPYIRITTSKPYYPPSTRGYTPFPQTKPTTGFNTYPLYFNGSSGARQVNSAPILGSYPQAKPTSGSHTYPQTSGGSGSGYKPILDPRTGSFSRPPNTNTVTTTINLNTGHPAPISYNNHVFVRNQPAISYTTNTRTTHIYQYPYNPPHQIYYTDRGNQVFYYSVYTGQLPNYVFEYRGSRSRYSKLLAGLALYNLGRVNRDSEIKDYHNKYMPRVDEMCIFSVYYDKYRFDDMEIDCRLITYFIWTQLKVTQPGAANENVILLPNRTMVITYSQIAPNGVSNALDPRFNGDYVSPKHIRCFMTWTVSYTYPRRKEVECGLLQTFVDRTMNSATTVTSTLLIVLTTICVLLFY